MTLQWIKSYLTDRTVVVHINNTPSSEASLTTGVPQGSVLGPLLFLIYLLPLQRVIQRHNVKRHGFANDTQLYNQLTLKDQGPVLLSLLTYFSIFLTPKSIFLSKRILL